MDHYDSSEFSFVADARSVLLFFFSSRRRHTRSDRDWSSDVCSSDLIRPTRSWGLSSGSVPCREVSAAWSLCSTAVVWPVVINAEAYVTHNEGLAFSTRSEERRVGKECRSRWSPYH